MTTVSTKRKAFIKAYNNHLKNNGNGYLIKSLLFMFLSMVCFNLRNFLTWSFGELVLPVFSDPPRLASDVFYKTLSQMIELQLHFFTALGFLFFILVLRNLLKVGSEPERSKESKDFYLLDGNHWLVNPEHLDWVNRHYQSKHSCPFVDEVVNYWYRRCVLSQEVLKPNFAHLFEQLVRPQLQREALLTEIEHNRQKLLSLGYEHSQVHDKLACPVQVEDLSMLQLKEWNNELIKRQEKFLIAKR